MSKITEVTQAIGQPVEVMDETALAVQLGQAMGRRQAYVELAGRCSAHEAACIKRIRDARLYLKLAPAWAEFCPKYLGMSKPSADRVIRWLEDFGPDFFTLAQLTRVTPEEYRRHIASNVADGSIRHCGESVKLIPENTEKVAAAVDGLRQPAASPDAGRETDQRLRALSSRSQHLVAEFKKLRQAGARRQELLALSQRTRNDLRLEEDAL